MGLDLLIDSNLKACALEINANPSLDIYFDQLFMQHKVHTDADVCPVDLYVKSRVVSDAIRLAQKKKIVD